SSRSIDMASDSPMYLVAGLLPQSSSGRGRLWLLLDPSAPVSIRTGSGNDVFRVHDLIGAPALKLDAGNGINTLDYSANTGDVVVDLPKGMATGFAGGISQIQNVTGGIGNNLIVGDANVNTLIGGTGRNVLIGGAGGDILDANKSLGDNILIGGTTDWDMNLDALNAIFAEWTRTDLGFADRFSDLTTFTNSAKAIPKNVV